MTLEERKQIRGKKLSDYYEAVDDRKALCGKLSDYINSFREVVSAYDKGKLAMVSLEYAGQSLPTQAELEQAVLDCREARNRENRLRQEAIQSGVEASHLPPLE